MVIDVKKENIYVVSKVTGIEYKVHKIIVEKGKVKKYLIENYRPFNFCEFEWWNVNRFREMYKLSSCPCCKYICNR